MYTPIKEEFGFIDSIVVAIIAILIVFIVLSTIIFIANLFSKVIVIINKRKNINPRVENKILEEDEDAVATVVVASLDFYNETKKHARLIKISKEEEWSNEKI